MKEPRVAVTNTGITGLDTTGADIECSLAISNPNSYDLTLLRYTYDLRVTDLPLASGVQQEQVDIPAGKTTNMRIPIHIKYSDLLEILKRRPDPDHVPYRLQASLQLATPVGNVTIPININETLKIPRKYRPENFLRQLLGAYISPP